MIKTTEKKNHNICPYKVDNVHARDEMERTKNVQAIGSETNNAMNIFFFINILALDICEWSVPAGAFKILFWLVVFFFFVCFKLKYDIWRCITNKKGTQKMLCRNQHFFIYL